MYIGGIKNTHTTPYHPMGNVITERFNRTLLPMLRCLNQDQKQDWKSHLVSMTHAYNSTVHDSTGQSPFYLMFGRQPRLAVDVLFKLHGQEHHTGYQGYVKKLKDSLEQAYRAASAAVAKASQKGKELYDLRVRGSNPVIGDRVLVKNLGLKGKHKLADKWESTIYIVVDRPNKDIPVFTIEPVSGDGRKRNIHRNLLLPISLPLDMADSATAEEDQSSASQECVTDRCTEASDSDEEFDWENGSQAQGRILSHQGGEDMMEIESVSGSIQSGNESFCLDQSSLASGDVYAPDRVEEGVAEVEDQPVSEVDEVVGEEQVYSRPRRNRRPPDRYSNFSQSLVLKSNTT